MNSTLYRAVPVTDSSIHGKEEGPRRSARLPMNVPYVVDNLWEYLRPESMPCRRHAVYASPSSALAASYISAAAKGRGTAVYELLISGTAKVVQLAIEDAKLHADIRVIRELLQDSSEELLASPWEAKQAASLLFMPGAGKADLNQCMDASPFAKKFIAQAAAKSTFWSDARNGLFSPTGEVFFELTEGSTYRLKALETA